MLVGAKFCGGCNAGYDRGAAYEKIKNHFDGKADFEYAEEGKSYDMFLLISGCTNRCAAIDKYNYKKLVSVWNQDEIKNAINEIENYIKGGR